MIKPFNNRNEFSLFLKKFNEISKYIEDYHKLSCQYFRKGFNKNYEYLSIDNDDFIDNKGINYSSEEYDYSEYAYSHHKIPLHHLLMSKEELINEFKKEKIESERREKIQTQWNERKKKNEKLELERENKEKKYKQYLELKKEFE